jgi:hypothetical protein
MCHELDGPLTRKPKKQVISEAKNSITRSITCMAKQRKSRRHPTAYQFLSYSQDTHAWCWFADGMTSCAPQGEEATTLHAPEQQRTGSAAVAFGGPPHFVTMKKKG